MRREVRSQAQLRDICLRTLKECDGFEQVDIVTERDPIGAQTSEVASQQIHVQAELRLRELRPRSDLAFERLGRPAGPGLERHVRAPDQEFRLAAQPDLLFRRRAHCPGQSC